MLLHLSLVALFFCHSLNAGPPTEPRLSLTLLDQEDVHELEPIRRSQWYRQHLIALQEGQGFLEDDHTAFDAELRQMAVPLEGTEWFAQMLEIVFQKSFGTKSLSSIFRGHCSLLHRLLDQVDLETVKVRYTPFLSPFFPIAASATVLSRAETLFPPDASPLAQTRIIETLKTLFMCGKNYLVPRLKILKRNIDWERAPAPYGSVQPQTVCSLDDLISLYSEGWGLSLAHPLRHRLVFHLPTCNDPDHFLIICDRWIKARHLELPVGTPDMVDVLLAWDQTSAPPLLALPSHVSELRFPYSLLYPWSTPGETMSPFTVCHHALTLIKNTFEQPHLEDWTENLSWPNRQYVAKYLSRFFSRYASHYAPPHHPKLIILLQDLTFLSNTRDYAEAGILDNLTPQDWEMLHPFSGDLWNAIRCLQDLRKRTSDEPRVRTALGLWSDCRDLRPSAANLLTASQLPPGRLELFRRSLAILNTIHPWDATFDHRQAVFPAWLQAFNNYATYPDEDLNDLCTDVQIKIAEDSAQPREQHESGPSVVATILSFLEQSPVSNALSNHIHRVTSFKIANGELWKKMRDWLQEFMGTSSETVTISDLHQRLIRYPEAWGAQATPAWEAAINAGYLEDARDDRQKATHLLLDYLETYPIPQRRTWFEAFMESLRDGYNGDLICRPGIWEQSLVTLFVLIDCVDQELRDLLTLMRLYETFHHQLYPIFTNLLERAEPIDLQEIRGILLSAPAGDIQSFSKVWAPLWQMVQSSMRACLDLPPQYATDFLKLATVRRKVWRFAQGFYPEGLKVFVGIHSPSPIQEDS